jgi:hypothetical protein
MDDIVKKIIAYENDMMSESQEIEFFQELVTSGIIWKLQSKFARRAIALIEEGLVDNAAAPESVVRFEALRFCDKAKKHLTLKNN